MDAGVSVGSTEVGANQGILSAVARQRGFVVRPTRAGITVQFPSRCIYPYVSLRVRVESTRASRFTLSTPYTLQTKFFFSPVGGEYRTNLGFVCSITTEVEGVKFCAGEGSCGDIDVSGTGEAAFQRSVLFLNSECSYEFLVWGLLNPDSGYSFFLTRTTPLSYPSPSTPY